MKMRATFFLLTLMLASGCLTHLRVSTEVFTGEVPKDPVPATVANIAEVALAALDKYDERTGEAAASNYGKVIRELQTAFPGAGFGDARSVEGFRESFREAAVVQLRPAASAAAEARAIATQLRAVACPTSTEASRITCNGTYLLADEVLQQYLTLLRAKLTETARLGREAIDRLDQDEVAQIELLLHANFDAPHTDDVLLRKFVGGPPIRNTGERKAAVTALIAKAQTVTANLRASDDATLNSIAVAQPLNAQNIAATTEIVPLFDPAISAILKQTEETKGAVWKKFVNDVESRNQWGNAEIAFRMDGLGDSHIKGVMFDSSQAMKTGFSVLAATVEATATAFGGATFAPLKPKQSSDSGTPQASEPAASANASALTSKPAIDAEVARLSSSASMRGEAMESLFWQVTTLGRSLPADGQDAADAAKKLLALVQCAATELADPTGRHCGGE